MLKIYTSIVTRDKKTFPLTPGSTPGDSRAIISYSQLKIGINQANLKIITKKTSEIKQRENRRKIIIIRLQGMTNKTK